MYLMRSEHAHKLFYAMNIFYTYYMMRVKILFFSYAYYIQCKIVHTIHYQSQDAENDRCKI